MRMSLPVNKEKRGIYGPAIPAGIGLPGGKACGRLASEVPPNAPPAAGVHKGMRCPADPSLDIRGTP